LWVDESLMIGADNDIPNAEDAAKSSPSLIEGEDYYLEGELRVLTERFLLRRGFCCESNCRHCPYGFGKET
jgi:hypothetical protein